MARFDDSRLHNVLDTMVVISRKQTAFHLFLDAALKTVAYLRVSTRSQDLANQKLAILEFSQKRCIPIDEFIEKPTKEHIPHPVPSWCHLAVGPG